MPLKLDTFAQFVFAGIQKSIFCLCKISAETTVQNGPLASVQLHYQGQKPFR